MGIIGKPGRKKSEYAATTLISKGCYISGEFKLETDMQVDGIVEGKIKAENTIVVSEHGAIKGDIYANKIIINGLFEGKCYATSVEILSKGNIVGEVYSKDLSIELGGKFKGVTGPTPENFSIKNSTVQTENKPTNIQNKPQQNIDKGKKTAL